MRAVKDPGVFGGINYVLIWHLWLLILTPLIYNITPLIKKKSVFVVSHGAYISQICIPDENVEPKSLEDIS